MYIGNKYICNKYKNMNRKNTVTVRNGDGFQQYMYCFLKRKNLK